MKFKSHSVNHILMNNLPPPPSKEALSTLVDNVIAGDQEAKQQLIRHFLLVARQCIGTILAVYPSYQKELEEMVSEAAFQVVDIVDKISKGSRYEPKLMSYVAVTIFQQVNEMLSSINPIKIPLTTQRRMKGHGKEFPVNFSDEEIDDISHDSTDSDFEVREALEAVISTPVEQKIIELRESGYTDTEIGETLGLSQSTICLLRLNLYQRYVEVTR